MEIAPLKHLHGHGTVSSQSVINKCWNGPLGVVHLTNLQALDLRAGSCCNGEDLGKLIKLKEMTTRWTEIQQIKNDGFFESIKKLIALRSLCLYSTYGEETLILPQLMSFSDHMNLYHLSLGGRLENSLI